MATVRRFDRGQIQKAEKTADGFLRAPAFIARTGIYLYADASGKVTRELRRPEQVFAPESLASFALVPVTDEHPPEGYVDSKTAKIYQRGSIGEGVEADGNMVRALMMITDGALVRKVLDGDAVECSCGYVCEVLEGGGEWNGEPYDTEQTNIRGNHVAIVPAGRAGPAARVRLDAGDAIALPREVNGERAQRDDTHRTQETPMEKEITINGQTFKLPGHVVDAINAQRSRDAAEAQTRLDAFGSKKCEECGATMKDGKCPSCDKKKNDALQAQTARADAAAAEVVALKAEAVTVAASTPKLVADAVEVIDVARRAGVEVKLDALDLPALRRAVAEKVNGVSLEGKADAYVAAAFDLARAKVDNTATGAGHFVVVEGEKKVDGEESSLAARERMTKRNADAWKPAAK